jgi:hypothetical protein
MPAPASSRGRARELAPRAPPARRWTGRRRVLGGRERGVRGRARSRQRLGGAENIARISGEDRVVAHGCVTLHIPAAAAGGPRAAPGPISRLPNGPNRGHTRSSAPSRSPIDRPTPTTEYFGGLAGRAAPSAQIGVAIIPRGDFSDTGKGSPRRVERCPFRAERRPSLPNVLCAGILADSR